MPDYTFFYVVGGPDMYYDQLRRSIKSLSRLNVEYKVRVLDVDRKLEPIEHVEIFYTDERITQKHIFWKHKYNICQKLDTRFGIYLDCDTIVVYDKVEEACKKLHGRFGVIQHFYLSNFLKFRIEFLSYATDKFIYDNKIAFDTKFFAGGVFFFENNQINIDILKEVVRKHDEIYSNNSMYFEGLYDETFLSYCLIDKDPVLLSGSYNHCCANMMPLQQLNGELYGGNPFDDYLEKIFVFHGYTERQINGEDFDEPIRGIIKKYWYE